jgi:hypothetical protein
MRRSSILELIVINDMTNEFESEFSGLVIRLNYLKKKKKQEVNDCILADFYGHQRGASILRRPNKKIINRHDYINRISWNYRRMKMPKCTVK